MKLLAIDGNSILNRAFYGIRLLTTKDGRFTNGIVGFMNILGKLTDQEHPDAVAIAFDLKTPTFRHKAYAGYKKGRKPMPAELAQQMPVLKELLADLGYRMITAEGYEADDILGTLAAAATVRGYECVIATGDRDSLQLVSPATRVLLASTAMGQSVTTDMDEAAVRGKYGVSPRQLIEVKALMGDASDNIPGVAGVGEKTATGLIARFGDLKGVYAHLDDPSIRPALREKLAKDRDQAAMSRMLAEIVTDAPVPLDAEAYLPGPGDPDAAAKLLASLEMTKLLEKLHLEDRILPGASPDMQSAALPSLQPLPLPAPDGKPADLLPDSGRWAVIRGGNLYAADPADRSLLDLIEDPASAKRVFDSKPLYRLAFAEGKPAVGIGFDAKLAAYLLNPLASRYEPAQLAAEYGAEAAFTSSLSACGTASSLFDKLAEGCRLQGMDKLLEEIEIPLAEVLASMEDRGFLVDRKGITEFGATMKSEIEKELAQIYDLTGYEFNVNSPKQLGEALFDKLGLPAGKKTKSGWSTNADTLESLRGMHPAVDHILLYRTYKKLDSTYVEGLLRVIGPDGRVHTNFNQTETRTGRISSDEPNLQNIPVRTPLGSQMRQFFTAPEGFVLLDADYSQIELRILAALSGDRNMQQAFRDGLDIHRSTASRIFGVPFDMVTPQLRSRAKAVNFGIVYGIGAFSLAKNTGVSVKEADRFIKSYLSEFSGVRDYMEKAVEDGHKNGYVTTLYGRRRPLPELAAANHAVRALGERIARNTPIQGTAADIIKLAMVRVYRRMRAEGLQSRLILQVHDELIVEAPEAEADRAAVILEEEMENAAHLDVKLEAKVSRGKTWYDAKE